MVELADDILHHAALDARMVRVARSIKLLNMVSWPASEQQRFLAGYEKGDYTLPNHQYPKYDFTEARRELKTLAAADRPPVQAWLDKADGRDAALAASRQFANEAMGAFTKPAQ